MSSQQKLNTLSKPPFLLHIRSHTNFILVTVVLAVFIDSFLYGLILPVIPLALASQTGVLESESQQWNSILSACFSGALFLASPLAGAYADKSSIGLFMGYVSIALSAGLLISPLIGGLLYEHFGYYATYSAAFALVALDIVLRLLMIEKRHAAQWLPEAAASPAKAPSRVESDLESRPSTATEEKEMGLKKTAAAYRAPRPKGLKNHRYVQLITSPRMLATLTGVAVHAIVIVSLEVTVPLFVKNTYGWNSTAAGLVLLASMLPSLLSPVIGAISDRYGAKWPTFAGFLLSIPILISLRFAEGESDIGHKATLISLLFVLGITMGLADSPMMAEITYAIQDAEAENPGMWGDNGVYGIAYGLFTTFYALGETCGGLMGGYLVSGPGWSTYTWVISIWCLVGSIAVVLYVGGDRRPESTD
ncbi:membrane transporter [Magnaporthiopsis poae ATCC 64411]|uniref:Membrane transporter n=1 Tax=Magnaporthiopsis poae (strain ATCC 64411 / 73-15) TaxID=644358 RepID=A0A0C4DZC2_MAGP6|nr:membrane transporter [Magnaporthiopsis poae ATCC 64411]